MSETNGSEFREQGLTYKSGHDQRGAGEGERVRPAAGASVLIQLRGEEEAGEGQTGKSNKLGESSEHLWPLSITLSNWGRYRAQEEQFADLRSCKWSKWLPEGQPAKATPSSVLCWAKETPWPGARCGRAYGYWDGLEDGGQ